MTLMRGKKQQQKKIKFIKIRTSNIQFCDNELIKFIIIKNKFIKSKI